MQTQLINAIKVVESKDQISICLKKFTVRHIIQLIFMVIVSATFLPYYIQGAITGGAWFFIPVAVPFFVYVFYVLLTNIINSICIDITNDLIRVTQGPLPYFGNKKLSLEQFRSLQIEERINQGRSLRTYYDLIAYTNFGSNITLIKDIEKLEQVEYIKLKLEKFIGAIRKQ